MLFIGYRFSQRACCQHTVAPLPEQWTQKVSSVETHGQKRKTIRMRMRYLPEQAAVFQEAGVNWETHSGSGGLNAH